MLNKRSVKEREKLMRRKEQESDSHCTDEGREMLNKWSRKERETLMRGREREREMLHRWQGEKERERGAEQMVWGRERDIEQMRREE